jgi:putative transposase
MKTFDIRTYPNLRPGGHTLYRNIYHIVFSTKNRKNSLTPIRKIQIKQWLRLKEEEFNFRILVANGYQDHIHFLIDAPLHLSVAKLVQHIKGYTSRLMDNAIFWQRGYYSETIEKSELENIYRYIRYQYHHHSRKKGIQTEREIYYLSANSHIKKPMAA